MRLSTSEISAAVFYTAIASSQSRPEDPPIGGIQWRQDDNNHFVRIFRTEVPWDPIDYQGAHRHENNFAFVAWVAVLSVAVSAACLVLLFCVCWRLCGNRGSRRQSSNANLMESRATTAFRAGPDGVFRPPPGNIYGSGVVNFAFTGSLQDPVPLQYTEDKPPEYSAVVAELSPNDKQVQPLNSTIPEDKPPLETPPPAYVSATTPPFSDSPR